MGGDGDDRVGIEVTPVRIPNNSTICNPTGFHFVPLYEGNPMQLIKTLRLAVLGFLTMDPIRLSAQPIELLHVRADPIQEPPIAGRRC